MCLEAALNRVDDVHREDPSQETVEGETWPAELLYAQRMTEWLERLDPRASDALCLAVRAQHLARWELPRESYPEGRADYLRWRTEQARRHARKAEDLMRDAGCAETLIHRVQDLIQKRNLKSDPEAQTLEDAAALTFMEYYLPPFVHRHDEDKVISIIQKTWNKISPRGREAAKHIQFPGEIQSLIDRALEGA